MENKEIYIELFSFFILDYIKKDLIYTELFSYLIEKQSIYIRNRYSNNIPKKGKLMFEVGNHKPELSSLSESSS